MHPTYLLMVVLAGSGLAFQAPINARLREYAGSAIAGALISFAVGTIVLIGLSLGAQSISLAKLRTAPWWAFTGGAIGVVYVMAALASVPRIGAAMLLAAAVTGQLIGAMLIDHNGWFGVERAAFSMQRLVGAALLMAALWCFRK